MCLWCALHLASIALPLCPTYPSLHAHKWKDYRGKVRRTPDMHMRQSEKSPESEHSVTTVHYFNFNGTSVLHRTLECVDQLVKTAVEVHLHMNSFNRDCVVILSQAWSPISNVLMNVKAGPNQSRYKTPPTNDLVSPAVTGRYIMAWTDLSSRFSYAMGRGGPQNVGVLTT
jgi:hypothetical protein